MADFPICHRLFRKTVYLKSNNASATVHRSNTVLKSQEETLKLLRHSETCGREAQRHLKGRDTFYKNIQKIPFFQL